MTITAAPTSMTGFTFERDGTTFFESDANDIPSMLLALLCHPSEAIGSTLRCDRLTMSHAALLAPYRLRRVNADIAESDAVTTLHRTGTTVIASTICEADAFADNDNLDITTRYNDAASPSMFWDELRLNLLTALQRRTRLVDNWLSLSPATTLGGGGGGT